MPESSRHRGILWPRSYRWAIVHHLNSEEREKLSPSEQFTCATCAIFTERARCMCKLHCPEGAGLGWPLGICTKISMCCKLLFLSEETDPHCFYQSTGYSQVSKHPSLIRVLGSSGLIFTAVSPHSFCMPLKLFVCVSSAWDEFVQLLNMPWGSKG